MDPLIVLGVAMGGDTEDAVDLAKGAKWIPGEVTMRRRRGEYVNYIPGDGECPDCWVDVDGKTVT